MNIDCPLNLIREEKAKASEKMYQAFISDQSNEMTYWEGAYDALYKIENYIVRGKRHD